MPGNQANRGRKSYYRLDEVQDKIRNKEFLITAGARERAFNDFGWNIEDILDALLKLRPSHFSKSEISNKDFPDFLDYYTGRINGEKIFTHFRIERSSGKLIIDSFHELKGE